MLRYYQFVVWVDYDTLFWTEAPVPVHRNAVHWFGNYSRLNVLFPNHGKKHLNLNSGIIILKQSPFTFQFLERVYREYVNRSDITAVHGDQDAFQHYIDHNDVSDEVMVIPTGNLQTIYKLISGDIVDGDYMALQRSPKRWNSVLLHRVGTPSVKYFQMRDIAISWIDPAIYGRMKHKCPQCFQDERGRGD